jgi:hypothetical protein
MEQFVIPATFTHMVLHSIKGSFMMNWFSQIILAPFALALRQWSDLKARTHIMQQKTTVKATGPPASRDGEKNK